MSVAEWTDTFGIHHRRVISSTYRMLTWIRFEPITTEFCWDALTDWAIKPWVQLALRANFAQLCVTEQTISLFVQWHISFFFFYNNDDHILQTNN